MRHDRTARLVRVANLLRQSRVGLTVAEIAGRTGVAKRTVNRDLRALEDGVGVGVWQRGGRYGVMEGSFLPPLKLTLLEGVTLFLAARLMERFQDRADPHVLSAFEKLAGVLPQAVAEHVQATIASMAGRARDPDRERVFDALARAWAGRRRVRIWYPRSDVTGGRQVVERTVDPYYLEPNPGGHTRYLIGRDGMTGTVRTFRAERIERVEEVDEGFDVPLDFDAAGRLRSSFIISDEDLVEVRLRFHEEGAAVRAAQTQWHPSQRVTQNADGTLDLTLAVNGLRDIRSWILGWGDVVEVLAPAELRTGIETTLRAAAGRYGGLTVEKAHEG